MELDFSKLAPVSRAEAAAAGLASTAPPPPIAETAEPARLAPRRAKRKRTGSAPARPRTARTTVAPALTGDDAGPHFAGGPARALAIPLTYPVRFAGRTIAEIILRRMGGPDVTAFFAGLATDAEAGRARTRLPPIFYGRDGVPIPVAVIDFLDPDDDELLTAAVPAFLPERVKRALGLA